jgi:hypothetical protein
MMLDGGRYPEMIVVLAGIVVVVLLVAVFVLGGWLMRRRVRSVRRVEARVVARLRPVI